MIYVEILGRMGNQMFSYAMARKLQSKDPGQGIEMCIRDRSWTDQLYLRAEEIVAL